MAVFPAPLIGIGRLLLALTAAQPAVGEGYGPVYGAGAPGHREAWLSDGYWLDGENGAWAPATQAPAPHAERYRLQPGSPTMATDRPWPSDYRSYGYQQFAEEANQPDLRSTYISYGAGSLPGSMPAPFAGDRFRPLDQALEFGQPAVERFAPRSFDPYGDSLPGTDAYGFRPALEPQRQERANSVWYRERASGTNYLFRPVSDEERVSRPSDHSFNSPRYAQPQSSDFRPMPGDGFATERGGGYGLPGVPYSGGGRWVGDAYGGPMYGFE